MKKIFNRAWSDKLTLAFAEINRRMRKGLAIVLIIAMLGSLLPRNTNLFTYAYDVSTEGIQSIDSETNSIEYATTTDEDYDISDVAIDEEIESLRTLDSKTFRRIDGMYVVAIYNTAIHFFDGEKYQEIDNTLLYDSSSNSYKNTSNQISVSLPCSLDETNGVSVSYGEFTIYWSPLNSSQSVINSYEKEKTSENELNLENISQSVSYSTVKSNVNLEYILSGMNVKENIVLTEYQKDFSMAFRYNVSGLTLEQNETGNWSFYDNYQTEVFVFGNLWMYDAAGEYTDEVALSVKEENNGIYIVSVMPNDNWLSHATYPVTIDPSLYSSTSNMSIQDTYVYSGTPNTSYTTSVPYLRISSTSSTYFYRALLQFTLGQENQFCSPYPIFKRNKNTRSYHWIISKY
jgi:hypothetical protein